MNEGPLLLKSHTFQFALHMLNVDHLNIDSSPFPVKCLKKFGFALGRQVTYRYAGVCTHFRCEERTLCMFFTCEEQILMKRERTQGLLLVLASVLDSSSLKNTESTLGTLRTLVT